MAGGLAKATLEEGVEHRLAQALGIGFNPDDCDRGDGDDLNRRSTFDLSMRAGAGTLPLTRNNHLMKDTTMLDENPSAMSR